MFCSSSLWSDHVRGVRVDGWRLGKLGLRIVRCKYFVFVFWLTGTLDIRDHKHMRSDAVETETALAWLTGYGGAKTALNEWLVCQFSDSLDLLVSQLMRDWLFYSCTVMYTCLSVAFLRKLRAIHLLTHWCVEGWPIIALLLVSVISTQNDRKLCQRPCERTICE